jgi:group I intron endonuclease
MSGGIYCIRNLINNKRYIGQAVNFRIRKNTHYSTLERNKHDNPYLQNAYNKYGKDNFVFEILEIIENMDLLTIREQYWKDHFTQVYNIRPIVDSNRGIKWTDDIKRKMGRGKIGKPLSNEHKLKISHANKGKPKPTRSIIHSKKISKSLTGRTLSEEHVNKISLALKGKTRTIEHNINNAKARIKPIVQIDIMTNEIVKVWEGGSLDASQSLGLSATHIRNVCSGHRKSAGGYNWRYL